MIITVTPHMFRDAFEDSQYRNNFSAWALDELYGYLEECELGMDNQIELDCTAIACDFMELGFRDVLAQYATQIEIVERLGLDDKWTDRSDEDIIVDVAAYLEYNTTVIAQDNDGTFLFAVF